MSSFFFKFVPFVKIRLFSLSFRRCSIIIVGKTSKDKNLRRRIEKKRKDPKKTLLSFEDDDKTQQNKAPLTKRLIKRNQITNQIVRRRLSSFLWEHARTRERGTCDTSESEAETGRRKRCRVIFFGSPAFRCT